MLWVVFAIALVLAAGFELNAALQSPGQAIRGELRAAAADLQAPQAAPSERVLARLRYHFRDREMSVDAAFWPLVLVTLHHIDRSTCRDAAAIARRIEGLVVVELEHYRDAGECRDTNDMTWRLMP